MTAHGRSPAGGCDPTCLCKCGLGTCGCRVASTPRPTGRRCSLCGEETWTRVVRSPGGTTVRVHLCPDCDYRKCKCGSALDHWDKACRNCKTSVIELDASGGTA